jgi:hypothetical protein
MKFEIMPPEKNKSFRIPRFVGGVSSTAAKNLKRNDQLIEGKNITYSNYQVFNRNGLNCQTQGILDLSSYIGAQSIETEFTDTEITVEGELLKIAIANVIYDNSHRFSVFFGINKDAAAVKLGFIHFGRVDENTFFVPKNITLFVGKPWQGGGIFAFVTTYNLENPDTYEYQIYEAPKIFGEWSICMGEYTPTVYINGRGTNYEIAKDANLASTVAPRVLETPNLLSGEFLSYYTSDGHSASFKLPYSNISNGVVSCRLFISPEKQVQWIIKENEVSAKATLENKEIIMTVERSKGIVYFSFEDQPFHIARMNLYPENNLLFFASLNSSDKFKEIVSCTKAVKHGDVTVFCGGINNSKLYYNSTDNPLYFREYSHSSIGDKLTGVTALISAADKIYAFKENSIYSLTVSNQKAINSAPLLADNDAIFFEPREFLIKCVNNTFGSYSEQSIAQFKKSPLWYKKGKLFTLNSSNKTAVQISKHIEKYISEEFLENAITSVAQYNGLLITANKNKAVIMQFDTNETKLNCDNVAFFTWEFPENIEICGLKAFESGVVFLCRNTTCDICFTTKLDGNVDRYPILANNTIKFIEQDIEIFLKTKYDNFTLPAGEVGRTVIFLKP